MPAPKDNSVTEKDLLLVRDAVREAGHLALSFFKKDYKVFQKKEDDPVTEADYAVNDFLKKALHDNRSDYGWLSEETEDDPARIDCARTFVIDPIDGTRAFIKGDPHFTVCVAVLNGTAPELGFVFNPATDEFFEAVVGGGATMNGRPIQVAPRQDISQCRMLAFEPMFKHKAWPEPWPEMTIENRNSMAYRIALVAAGEWDATVALNPKNDWDLAAAHVILTEAGGLITRHDGSAISYNGLNISHRSVIAAGPDLHARLVEKTGELKLPD